MSSPSADQDSREFEFRVLPLRERRRLFTGNPSDRILWPGAKALLLQRIRGSAEFVVGAVDGTGGALAARAMFVRSCVNPLLWHYGYLFTDPAHRHHGLGERVMHAGLARAAALGARYCDCYVAEDNVASLALNRKLGFHELPFVRAKLSTPGVPRASIRLVPLGAAAAIRSVLERIGGTLGADVIEEELRPGRSMRFWKRPTTTLWELRDGERPVGWARCATETANVAIVETEDQARWDLDLLGALGALGAQRGTAVVLAFASRDRWLRSREQWPASTYDHVLLHPDLQRELAGA